MKVVKAFLREWFGATNGMADPSFELVRMRALLLSMIIEYDDVEHPTKIFEFMNFYGLSPHVASPTEAALLARERVTRGVSAEERAHALYNDALTFLEIVAALQLEPGDRASRIQLALLALCHERGTVARDMAAQVPGVVTADGLAGTAFHLAIANGHTTFLRSVLRPPYNLDPARLPPFLGAHTALCWATMTDQVEVLEVLLEHYKRRGSEELQKALAVPCCTLSPAQAAERRDDPLAVRPPYLLILHTIEHRALGAYNLLCQDRYAVEGEGIDKEAFSRHKDGGRILSPLEACAFHAWRAELEVPLGPEGDEEVLAYMAEKDRSILLNYAMDGTGTTLLHMACKAERPEAEILATVRLLLDKGAHPLAVDACGRTPGDIIKERSHASVTAALTLGAAALEQNGTVGTRGFRPQVVKAVTRAEVDAALGRIAGVKGSGRPTPPTPPSASSSSSSSAAARGPKRTGLKLRPGLSKEMEKAVKSGDLHKLEACAREWDAAHPDAPAGFGTDAWVPALWLAAHEAGILGRMRVLKWLVEEMGVRVHRLLPEEEELIRGSAEATAEPFHTPLASAVYNEQEAAALYLLRAGAERGDIDAGHHCGEQYSTLLFLAINRNVSARLLTALMEEGGFDPGVKEGVVTPLARAIGSRRIELVGAILAYARRHGRLESAFKSCMDPEAGALSLFTAVMERRKLEMLKHLVATLRQADLPGFDLLHSALHAACRAYFAPALNLLLAPERAADAADWGRAVDVNATFDVRGQFREGGQTLLHVVFAQPSKTVKSRSRVSQPGEVLGTVELLLEKGADPTIKDKDGKTPIQLAREKGFGEAAERMERVANKGQREEAARAAEAELLGLLEQEEAKASKEQQKKAKKKGKGKGGGGKEAGRGADGAAAGLAAVSLADSDGEEEKAAAGGQQPQGKAQQSPPLSEEEVFILARAEAEAPDFICPLTRRIMRDVALASDGFSYERGAIEAHIRRCQAAGRTPDSPKTEEKIDPMLLPNRGLANLIATWLEEQRRAFRAAVGTGV